MIKLFSSIFYLCLSARGCVHPVTRTYTQNPAQPKNNCIQMNLYKSLVPMVSSSETHSQHKRPHKLLDRLFLNNCQTAWASLPFRGTPRQGRRIIQTESRLASSLMNSWNCGVFAVQHEQVMGPLPKPCKEKSAVGGSVSGEAFLGAHVVLHANRAAIDLQRAA